MSPGALARFDDPPLEPVDKIVEAGLADPVVFGTLFMLGDRCVALGEHVWMFGYVLAMSLRKLRIHELRPAKGAVIMFPRLAPRPVATPGQCSAEEVLILVRQTPIVVVGHDGQWYGGPGLGQRSRMSPEAFYAAGEDSRRPVGLIAPGLP